MQSVKSFTLVFLFFSQIIAVSQNRYESNWNTFSNSHWIGEEYWANRLQDWKIKDGNLQCIISGKNRSVALLTHNLGDPASGFQLEGSFKVLNFEHEGQVGFKLGNNGPNDDYRSAAVYGEGLFFGVSNKGELVMAGQISMPIVSKEILANGFDLKLSGELINGQLGLSLQILRKEGETLMEVRRILDPEYVKGGVGLISNFQVKEKQLLSPSVEVSHWSLEGNGFEIQADRVYGPIYFAKYTMQNGHLKMTAQCAPIDDPTLKAQLYIKVSQGWQQIAESNIMPLSRNAIFEVESLDIVKPTSYKIILEPKGHKVYQYSGVIQPEPNTSEELKLGLFSCNQDHGFPDADLRSNILKHNIDAALFLGDQFYEGFGGFGVEKTNLERSALDYLRKWLMFGWSYRDVFRSVPMISIPDDHDVYHGNVWGEAGKKAIDGPVAYEAQDQGGYKMPAEWVTMVQETQTAHLPSPQDALPVQQGIPVYFTSWNWGPVSFAILEDRKFKTAPKNYFPAAAQVTNGFVTQETEGLDKYYFGDQAELLGKRQEDFLENWTQQWRQNTYFKVVLSQTNLATLATLPKGETSDQIVPQLEPATPGTYISGDFPTKDMDSNGWPKAKRDKAVSILRKGYALQLAGDQHLASVVQYGIEEYGDAGFAFSGPALNNTWPRRWWPPLTENHKSIEGQPLYTGNFEDGFKNKVTVHAVANPTKTGLQPKIIHERATGYGIVKLKPQSQDITLECWPRYVDPSIVQKQYEGWPITINLADNFGKKAYAYLGPVQSEINDPLVQLIDAKTKEVIYTRRFLGNEVKLKVFEKGKYLVKMGASTETLKMLEQKFKVK